MPMLDLPKLNSVLHVTDLVDKTGYTALVLAERFPKLELPDDTWMCYWVVSLKKLCRIDSKGNVYLYDSKAKEWTDWCLYNSYKFWSLYANKGLRPVE